MIPPSKAPNRWIPYLAFLWLLGVGKYTFDVFGRARKNGKLAARTNRNGYRRIPFRLAGNRYEVMEHVAFWIWFHRSFPPRGLQINHKDLDRQNGQAHNLELVTQSGNIKHRIAARRRAA